VRGGLRSSESGPAPPRMVCRICRLVAPWKRAGRNLELERERMSPSAAG